MSSSLKEVFESYKKWVSNNPVVAADVETTVKWISYLFAGKVNNSGVVSELVYSLCNLLVLFNDRIISDSRRSVPSKLGSSLKTWLTVLEYAEVFIEITAKHVWGGTAKWIVIAIIQLAKCVARLALLYSYKENIVQVPPIPPLKRKDVVAQDIDDQQPTTVGFQLKSGRIVRSVNNTSPTHVRTWKPPTETTSRPLESIPDKPLNRDQLIAETLYIIKPVVHLLSMWRFGPQAWRPYLVSLSMDLLSLQIFRASEKGKSGGNPLSPRQRMEISRREVQLLLYILRSPFYDRHSKMRIRKLLYGMSDTLPLVGLVLRPLAQYIPHWQEIYFYMWSS